MAPAGSKRLAMLLTAAAASAGSVVLAFVAPPGSTYRFAPLFLIPLIWGVYLLRARLYLHPLHYLLFCIAVLLHNLGALGYYQQRFFGINYDAYVHNFFGLVGGLIIYRLLGSRVPALTRWQLRVATLMFIMGIGALHELMEWGSTLALGPEKGMLKPESVTPFDTQRDLFSNLLGVTTALLATALLERATRRGTIEGTQAARRFAPQQQISRVG